MKKIGLLLMAFGLLANSALAMKFSLARELYLDHSQFIGEDWYAAAEELDFYGHVLKDASVMASHVHWWGLVGQDLQVAAVEADIRGRIGDDLRVMALKAVVAATVDGDALIVANKVLVEKAALLNREVVIAGSEITVEGGIQGPVKLYGQKVIVNSLITNDLQVEGERVVFGPLARMLGRVQVVSSQAPEVDAKTYFSTPMNFQKASGSELFAAAKSKSASDWFMTGKWYCRFTLYLGLIACGALLLVLLPQPTRRYALVLRYHFWQSLGWGLFSLITIPILALIFLVTLIGIPIFLVIMLFYLAVLLLGRIGAGYLIGLWWLKPDPAKMGRNVLSFFLGFTLLTLIGWIPYLGSLVIWVAMILGLGAIWLTKHFVEPSAQPVPVATPEIPASPITKPPAYTPQPPKRPQPPAISKPALTGWKPSVPAFKKTGQGKSRKRPPLSRRTSKRRLRSGFSRKRTNSAGKNNKNDEAR